MNEKQHNSQNEAHTTNDNVGNAQERILATQQRSGRYNHALGTIEFGHRIIWKEDKYKMFIA